ncbi:protein NUCLEAR FUSION DEFECTIVE 4-like isoform X2 [Herrania umbratica]|uniref:Protein NUCLEAR FUSION DEFECTIVE 4-like isoform X2 n=1 Tax=Herrania umbratica TaxID=108875 RepID=A0A6J1AZW2_9ROSI|nr:protein NUCLEAR FUSION DEFECTIVE 4-like isoform X2 [Herrania umbratica]
MESLNLKMKYKLNNKWISTVGSIWIQCTSGSLYTFSIYSPTLKSTQNYDQSTLDTVSVFKDIGANCGVLSGVLYTFAVPYNRHSRLASSGGPWLVHVAGVIQCFTGYFLIWASVIGLIPRPPVVGMCLFMLLAAHAQSFFNTANVVTAVRNFPDYSGTVVGLMKGFLGLSGAILIQVYETIFNNKPISYLLMLALLPAINPLLLMWYVRPYDSNEQDEKKLLNALVASPLCIALRAQERGFSVIQQSLFSEGDRLLDEPQQPDAGTAAQDPACYHHFSTDADQEINVNDTRNPEEEENLNLLQAMCTVNFWILFFAMASGMGSGLATVNNLGQIGESLGYLSFETNTLVSLWSIWNFLGRFVAGYVSDYFLHVRGYARPLFMVLTLATMSVGHAVIASGLPGALYAGSILVGVCYGSQWSLMPTIASEIFGVRHMGTIFNAITIASPVGSYIFSVKVVGYIYDMEASGEGNSCTGTHCFMLSYLIMASAALLGSLAALCLFFRTKSLYNQVILRRLLRYMRE